MVVNVFSINAQNPQMLVKLNNITAANWDLFANLGERKGDEMVKCD